MKGRQAAWIILGIAVVAIIGVGVNSFMGGKLFAIPASGSVLAVSQINFIKDATYNEAWRIALIANGGGEYVQPVYVSKDQLSAGGKTALSDVSIGLNTPTHDCIFPLSVDPARQIYKFQTKLLSGVDNSLPSDLAGVANHLKDICASAGYPRDNMFGYAAGYDLGRHGYPYTAYCWKAVLSGNYGTIGTGVERVITTISVTKGSETATASVTKGSETATAVFSNQEGQQASALKVGTTEVGSARFEGLLGTGISCPNVGGYNAPHDLVKRAYFFSTDTAYSDYASKYSAAEDAITELASIQFVSDSAAIDRTYSKLQAATSAASSLFSGTDVAEWNQKKFITLVGSDGLQHPYFQLVRNIGSYPLLTVTVKAAWIGIVQSQGIPKLTCKDTNPKAGEPSESVFATLQNVGQGTGAFNVYVDGCGGSVAGEEGLSRRVLLDAGASTSMTIPLTYSQAGNPKCKVTAEELNTLKTDSCFFTAHVTAACSNTCDAGYVADPTQNCACRKWKKDEVPPVTEQIPLWVWILLAAAAIILLAFFYYLLAKPNKPNPVVEVAAAPINAVKKATRRRRR